MDLNTVETYVSPSDRSQLTWEPGDAWLGGGTWLFSEPQPAVNRLIDLTALGWPALTADESGLTIAATCTLAELERWRGPGDWPARILPGQCCRALLGSFKVWAAATVGGNVCASLPAGPMTSLLSALDSTMLIWKPDGEARVMPVQDFVTGDGTNALAPGELVRSFHVGADAMRCLTAFRRESLTPVGRSAALVIGRRSRDGGSFVVTITAATTRPVVMRFGDVPTAGQLKTAINDASPPWHDDVHGDPEWRAHLTFRMAEAVRAELVA